MAIVEELLRVWSVTFSGRTLTQDIEIRGVRRSVEKVTSILPACNYDPEVFPDPTSVDFDRPRKPILAFAGGVHSCLGAHRAAGNPGGAAGMDAPHSRFRRSPVRKSNTGPEAWSAGNRRWSGRFASSGTRNRIAQRIPEEGHGIVALPRDPVGHGEHGPARAARGDPRSVARSRRGSRLRHGQEWR
jgi:hypothetical protein